jgi:hypothetical protein
MCHRTSELGRVRAFVFVDGVAVVARLLRILEAVAARRRPPIRESRDEPSVTSAAERRQSGSAGQLPTVAPLSDPQLLPIFAAALPPGCPRTRETARIDRAEARRLLVDLRLALDRRLERTIHDERLPEADRTRGTSEGLMVCLSP